MRTARTVEATGLKALIAWRSMGIGRFPTPLEQRTLAGGGGRTVWVKRDDQCGFGRGGVKARKIDYFVRELLDRGAGHLVTLATNVTNLVHDLTPLLRENGLTWTVYVTDDPPLPLPVRRERLRDVGGDVRLVGRSRAGVAARLLMAAAMSRLRKRRPVLSGPSLGCPASVIGVARGFIEMCDQMETQSPAPPATVFITVASGVTLAGLALGEFLLRESGASPVRIVGVPVYSGPVAAYARLLLRWTSRRLGLHHAADLGAVTLTDWREVGDFGRFGPATEELCRRIWREQELEIDPIYGGKTWSVMERMLSEGLVAEPCVYWHCGVTADWPALSVQSERS